MTAKNKVTSSILPLFDEFLLSLQVNNYSEETVYNYERDLDTFNAFLIHDVGIPFSKTNKNTIDQYKAFLRSRDRTDLLQKNRRSKNTLSSYSINRMLSSLRTYLKFLIDRDYTPSIISDNIKLVKRERKHPQVAEFNEILKLIEAPTKFETDKFIAVRNRAMLEMLFSTGMRISELLKLRRSDIDQSGKLFITGKGRKQRFVYLTTRAQLHIETYLQLRKDSNTKLFIPYRGKNVRDREAALSSNYVQMKIKRYRERLRINIPISAHSLRHGFATYLAEQGANPAAIQILLGHESLDTTTRYVHASDRYAEAEHKKFHPLKT